VAEYRDSSRDEDLAVGDAGGARGPRRAFGIGNTLLLLTLLVALIALLAAWAWTRNPPAEPDPQGTALPDRIPGAVPPQ
jgi:hypothetical protein